jgi:NAD(P)-dependent dehydrogenase (short-subunit alcohol dehydrogenase family)
LNSISAEEQERRKEGFPLGLGRPEDISYASIFLLSDAARWITGQNIIIDGGYTSK